MAEMELNTAKNVPLVDRLDQYYEDPDLVKGKPNLVNFPPEFSPIPCKPLFYDVALYHVEMPSLDHKLETPGAGAGAGGLGGWLGGWGWGKK
jgi:signal recognition particle subunit SRP68